MNQRIKIAAIVRNVTEVSLFGTVDLDYWQRKLESEQLEPLANGGKARLLISAVAGKYMGLSFRELSFSVLARDASGLTDLSGAFLIHAYNSRRSFAWIERTLFGAPYDCDEVLVESEPPSFTLGEPRPRLTAKLDYSSKNPNESYDLCNWQGAIFLPGRSNAAGADSKLFLARLWNGRVEIPFDQNGDKFSWKDASDTPCKELAASNFTPQTWFCATEASHAKSKTYPRGKCPPFSPDVPFVA